MKIFKRILLVSFLVLFGGIYIYAKYFDPMNQFTVVHGEEIKRVPERNIVLEYKMACRDAAEASLNDPDSADFENLSHFVATKKGKVYTIDVMGSAKNAFGGRVKFLIDCKINDSGKIVSLKQVM